MDSKVLSQLGLKMKELRVAKDYTQEYVANQLGIELRTYQRYEAGKHLTVDALLKIGQFYDASFFDVAASSKSVSSDAEPLKAVLHLLQVSLDETAEIRAYLQRREPLEVKAEVNRKLKYGLKVGK